MVLRNLLVAALLVGVGILVGRGLARREAAPSARPESPEVDLTGLKREDARPSLPGRPASGNGTNEVGGTSHGPDPTAQERFRQMTGETMAALPRTAELQELSEEELHSRPLPLQRAGAALGRISQVLRANSGLKEEGIRFYAECAAKSELVQTVRALCYRNLVSLGGIDRARELGGSVPDEVKRLAQEIP